MEVAAKFRYLRVTPRKLRLVADTVRGMNVQRALDNLQFHKRPIAIQVGKLIRSAVANANQKGGMRMDSLYVKQICVDQAAIMKRWTPRARGGSSQLQKKLSHIKVILDERI